MQYCTALAAHLKYAEASFELVLSSASPAFRQESHMRDDCATQDKVKIKINVQETDSGRIFACDAS
jgi:hypothetical protein